MRIATIGAGPTGLFLAIGLARRGHEVTVVDRDPGPELDGTWLRKGVMQFHHAHAFRPHVAAALQAEAPLAYERWLEDGAEPVSLPDAPHVLAGVRSRRQTFETALRGASVDQPGITFLVDHVDEVAAADRQAVGLSVAGALVEADLVIDASGRSGRATRHLRPTPATGGPCGIAYVDRQYQLHPGASPGPLSGPIAWMAELDGYQVILFLHERGIFSVLLIRPTDDRDLVDLRHQPAFEAACRAVPGLATWTDPDRARPVTAVLPGGPLLNYYRGQTGPDGGLALRGLAFVGDAVCTTTPNFGRGVTTSLLQARRLLELLDVHGSDLDSAIEELDVWCGQNMQPWVEDHVRMDEGIRRRWAGEDMDLSQRLPSDRIMAAAAVAPEIGAALGPYLSMAAGPSSLDSVEPRAREVYAGGWRPDFAEGPSRAELVDLVRASLV